jgi:imidazole glycerol-phosphate synthase subunit HisH
MTGIINYGAGNIRSVQSAVAACGEKTFVIQKPEDLKKADNIILPGVGSFADGMKSLTENKMIDPLILSIKGGKPFLGICLGLQLLFSHSEEGDCEGFNLIKGNVKRFSSEDISLRIPHMGWNKLKLKTDKDLIFSGIPDNEYFYFAHSYYSEPEDTSVIRGTTTYGKEFASVIKRENIVGVQFHPEKSGDNGILFIKNFLEGKWLR